MKFITLFVGLAGILCATSLNAADLTPGPNAPVVHAGQCIKIHRSPILNLPTAGEIRTDVEGKYEYSVAVSERRNTVYNRSQLYTWATETNVSCGKAIGFLKSGEVNEDQISECDCFYRRMTALIR